MTTLSHEFYYINVHEIFIHKVYFATIDTTTVIKKIKDASKIFQIAKKIEVRGSIIHLTHDSFNEAIERKLYSALNANTLTCLLEINTMWYNRNNPNFSK